MALIDIVKCEIADGEFCHKFPSEDLRIGSQLVVYPSQTAFLSREEQYVTNSLPAPTPFTLKTFRY